MTPEPAGSSSTDTLRRAYRTIQLLKRKVDESERARREPIAVVGIGCRFPGAVVDAASYWRALSAGVDAVREIPHDRWDVEEFYDSRPQQPGRTTARVGGFLDHIDRFDYEFFGISRPEALAMDPQQRLTLEVAWEALEDAGQSPSGLAGSRTGVFAAVCTNDFAMTHARDPRELTAHTSQGTAHGAVPGMVGYALDLRGPNVAVDSACSSSLVALHLASQSLRAGECDLALSGGVNVIMSPLTSIAFSQAGMLSRTGRSRPFDAGADGPVNGEGCGFVVLKRLSDAQRDSDRVLAVLLGSAVNHNGRGSSFTAPSSGSQRDVIRAALRSSGVSASDVSYVEAHGSSTPIGDVMEIEALADVYGRKNGSPLMVGTAKGNLGHLQAAGGIAGLIKVVLSLRHGSVPGTLNLGTPNPELALTGPQVVLPAEMTTWPALPGERVAGVSTFGFTGTNAHVIVGEAPPRPVSEPDERRPRSVLALSAKTGAALARLATRYAQRLSSGDGAGLADICFSANTGRAHLDHRLSVVGESAAEVAAQLRAFAEPTASARRPTADQRPDVAFVFPECSSHQTGTAAILFQSQPTFRRSVEECNEILRPLLGHSILPALGSEAVSPTMELPGLAQPTLFAVEYSLAQLWRSWGVEPAAVVGHGIGEYVAACVAGVMSLADALAMVAARSELLEELPGSVSQLPSAEPQLAEARLQLRLARLRRTAEGVPFAAPRIPMISTVTGELWPWRQIPGADHWCSNLRLPILGTAGVGNLAGLGYRTLLEVGPGSAPAERVLAPGLLPSLRPGTDDWQVMLSTLAELYASGVPVDWSGFDRDYRRTRVDVPTYPFEPTQCQEIPRASA